MIPYSQIFSWIIDVYSYLTETSNTRIFPSLIVYHTDVNISGMKIKDNHYIVHNDGKPISLVCYERSIIMEGNRIQIDDRSIPINPTNTSFCIRKGILSSTSLLSGPKDIENDSKWISLMILKRPISLYKDMQKEYGDITIIS